MWFHFSSGFTHEAITKSKDTYVHRRIYATTSLIDDRSHYTRYNYPVVTTQYFMIIIPINHPVVIILTIKNRIETYFIKLSLCHLNSSEFTVHFEILTKLVVIHWSHCSDVKMGTMAAQITSLTIVYWTVVFSGADHRKQQSSASLAFVRRIDRWLANSPHKGPVTRKLFPFDDVTTISFINSSMVRS